MEATGEALRMPAVCHPREEERIGISQLVRFLMPQARQVPSLVDGVAVAPQALQVYRSAVCD